MYIVIDYMLAVSLVKKTGGILDCQAPPDGTYCEKSRMHRAEPDTCLCTFIKKGTLSV